MKTITFVRHGQSSANAGGVTMEHGAIPLTALGHLHANTLAGLLPPQPSSIVVSKYLRAQDTARPYAARVGMAAQTHPLLHEFSTIDPSLMEGMNGEERRPVADAYWLAADPHLRMGENAETFTEFGQRVDDLIPQLHGMPDGAVVFGHGMWIGMLVWRLLGFKSNDSAGMKAFRRFQLGLPMPNGAVYRLREAGGHWHSQVDESLMRALLAVRLDASETTLARV
ncbi:MAG: Phosphoglycerate mutase [Rhodoferax sp.]|nr:Phosphoglycerate mutase [Rhodoferax sp.]